MFSFILFLALLVSNALCFRSKTLNKVQNLEELQQLIHSSPNLLIDFYSDYCGPCRVLSRTLSEIANTHADVTFVKVNVDEHPQLADEFKVSVLPTVFYLRNGQWTEKFMGAVSKHDLVKFIKRNYKKPQEVMVATPAQPMPPVVEEPSLQQESPSALPIQPNNASSKRYRSKQRRHF